MRVLLLLLLEAAVVLLRRRRALPPLPLLIPAAAALLLRVVGRVGGLALALALVVEAVEAEARPLTACFLAFLPFFPIVMVVVGRSVGIVGGYFESLKLLLGLLADGRRVRITGSAGSRRRRSDAGCGRQRYEGAGQGGPPVWRQRD